MLRAVGSTDATVGGGKSRKSGRGAGNAKGPNGGGGISPMNPVTLMFLNHAEGPNGFTNLYDSSSYDRVIADSRASSSNPTYSTSIFKMGSASVACGGPALGGKSIQATPTGGVLQVGTGDIGIQAWVYPTANAEFQVIYDQRSAGDPGNPTIYGDASGLYYFTASAVRITGPALALNTWSFVEWSRVSGTSRLFVNGVQVGSSYTDTTVFNDPNCYIRFGAFIDPAIATDVMYIDEARVFTAGGNTSTYTVPTTAFADEFTVTSTWNASDKAATVSLMNDNRVAYTTANFGAVRGTTARSSGKYQFECTFPSGGTMDVLVGIAAAGADLTNYPGAVATSYGWYSTTGSTYNNNSPTPYSGGYSSTDVIGVVYDVTAGTLTYYKNGVSAGTAFSSLSGSYYPCFGSGNNTAGTRACKINTGQTTFRYPIAGATAWG